MGGQSTPESGIKNICRVDYSWNLDIPMRFESYLCPMCKEVVSEMWPRFIQDNTVFCLECAFKAGYISETDYLKRNTGGLLGFAHAAINPEDGEICIYFSKKPPWDKTGKEVRASKKYQNWRNSVFERDNYTCQVCLCRGGNLEAHHIKPFAKFKKLRFVLNNGMTLCKECHKEIHRGAKNAIS